MSANIDKEGILEDFKKKLFAPIPNWWKASIKIGHTTELEYYTKVIVGQTFCGRQKERLKKRIISEIAEFLKRKEIDIVKDVDTIGFIVEMLETKGFQYILDDKKEFEGEG